MSNPNTFKLIIEGQEESKSETFTENAAAMSIRPGDKLKSVDGTREYEVIEKRYKVGGGVFYFDAVVSRQTYP